MIKTHRLASVYHEGVYRNIKKPAAIIEITVKNTANNIFLYFNNALPTPNTRAAKVNFDKSKKYFEVFSLLFFIKS